MRLTSLPYHELVNVGRLALILLGVVSLYLFYFGCTIRTIFMCINNTAQLLPPPLQLSREKVDHYSAIAPPYRPH